MQVDKTELARDFIQWAASSEINEELLVADPQTGIDPNRISSLESEAYGQAYPDLQRVNRATLDGDDLGLTLTEFELLRYLVRHPRKAFTRQQLLETIWKDAMMVTERTVDAHIKNLREKLGEFAKHIQTVRGVGYRMETLPA